MTIHRDMYDTRYERPLVWYGVWSNGLGLRLTGFHVWDTQGRWVGVYKTHTRATSEATRT